MKLKEEFIKLQKDYVYNLYEKLVYNVEDYDDISRGKMLDNILKEYEDPYFIFDICTVKELDFLKYAEGRVLDEEDIEKYKWEINELNKKCIFSKKKYCVFEELVDNVKEALKLYKKDAKGKKYLDDVLIVLISFVKIHVNLSVDILLNIMMSISDIKEEINNDLLDHPLINFYCGFYRKRQKNNSMERMIYYRDYFYLIDSVNAIKNKYNIKGKNRINLQDNFDIFYYNFPIRIPVVKKMVEEVSKCSVNDRLFLLIEKDRILNTRNSIMIFGHIIGEKLRNIISDALDEMPSAAMNGFTPKEYIRRKEVAKNVN